MKTDAEWLNRSPGKNCVIIFASGAQLRATMSPNNKDMREFLTRNHGPIHGPIIAVVRGKVAV